jgi:hypothetical protein
MARKLRVLPGIINRLRNGGVDGGLRRRGTGRRWSAEALEGRLLLSTFYVTDTSDDVNDTGSLRYAITQVDAGTGTGVDTIDFNISGTAPFTIQPASPLPTITHPVLIDGYSQPGSSRNTMADSDNAVLQIELDGASVGGDGLAISAGDSTVQGLVIDDFGNGIHVTGSGGDVVQGNFIGIDPSGSFGRGNYQGVLVDGTSGDTIGGTTPDARNIVSASGNQDIFLINGASQDVVEGNFVGLGPSGTSTFSTSGNGVITLGSPDNTIGGSVAGAGNVIGGLTFDGIQINGGGDSVVQGNTIGTDPTGTTPLGNGTGIVVTFGATGNTIGGTTSGAGNLVSGNNGDGILLNAGDDLVQGNLVGTDPSGTVGVPNSGDGIEVNDADITIGGTAAGAGNTIAYNGGNGVTVDNSSYYSVAGNSILSNSIHDNGKLGIDLGNDGVTPNHATSPTSGSNNFQNYPTLIAAVDFGTSTSVKGTLLSVPDATFTVQLFANPSVPTSAYGQGATYLGSGTVTTDDGGNASFQIAVPVAVPAGQYVAATATDASGDTSEFSADVPVNSGSGPIAAVDDSYVTSRNTTLTVPAPGVQLNDLSADGGSFTSSLVSQASHGSVTLNPDGSFSYTPEAGFVGADAFTYQDVEGSQASNTATVTIDVLPTTFTVTNTSDSGPGSLRQALLDADASNTASAYTVDFDIPGTGPFVIAPLTPLPALTHAALIDGYSQPGSSPNTLSQADNAAILIQLDGSNAGGADGLKITAGGSTVQGLAITRFTYGIELDTAGGDAIQGDFIGTDVTGSLAGYGNSSAGIANYGTPSDTIGGYTPAARDLISGNEDGVDLFVGVSGNLIAGDLIGTDATGAKALANSGSGVTLYGINYAPTTANTIGGTASGARNVISGNTQNGIYLNAFDFFDSNNGLALSGNVVQGNYIGTDITGTQGLGNGGSGIGTNYAANNTYGGTAAGAGNVVSDNGAGIILFGSGTGELVQGNYVGTDASGTKPLGNLGVGVSLSFGGSDQLGGTAAGAGNVISANGDTGVQVTILDTVQGNFIGTDRTGTKPLGNAGDGLTVASGSTIGGTVPGAGNVIGANGGNGINAQVAGGDVIEGNAIGTDFSGTIALGNTLSGVLLQAPGDTVGGTVGGAANLIADNGGTGVTVEDSVITAGINNEVLSNSIYNNGGLGIDLGGDGVTPNTPGGPHDGPNNLQNYPVLAAAVDFDGILVVKGSLNSAPSTTFTIQLFASAQADPSGHGEGQTLLGTSMVTTDAAGNASFQLSSSTAVAPGEAISATATDPAGNTSEFSADAAVVASSQPIYASNDSFSGFENTQLVVPAPGVQANDVAFDGGPFTSVVVKGPAHATLTLNPDGSLTYTPKANYAGPDTFTYQDVEGSKTSNVATVAITLLPTIFTVTNTNDSGPGSLRQAILDDDASAYPGVNSIRFKIPGTGPFVISPGSALPAVTHATVIDGYTQPGASANTLAQGDNAVILVQLDGANAGGPDGLVLAAGGSTVRGLAITRFNAAVHLTTAGGDLVAGDFLGTDPTGASTSLGNTYGVLVDGVSGNTIGGTATAARDVISSNTYQNVTMQAGASGNVVQGDYIGTDRTGTVGLSGPPFLTGVYLYDAPDNTIGGTAHGAGNLISSNPNNAIRLDGGSIGSGQTLIQGNLIGTDVTGTVLLNIQGGGISIGFSTGNTIGGTAAAARNVIDVGNGYAAIADGGGDLIQGDYIGTDITGSTTLAPAPGGIQAGGGDTIGGTVAGARNVIAAGVTLFGSANLLQGDYIGTDATGTKALDAYNSGVYVGGNANTLGGTTAAARLVISGNQNAGLTIFGGSGNLVEGDYIGTDATGTKPLGNAGGGVSLQYASNNTIGGTAAGARDVIADNTGNGVTVGVDESDIYSTGDVILSDAIYGNTGLGIDLGGDGVTPNTPGGPHSGPNDLQNYPVLIGAIDFGNTTVAKGTLNAAPNTVFTLQFYSDPAADPSGHGQGQTLLKTVTVATDGNGNAAFQVNVSPAASAGAVVTATATDPNGNTSEFSADAAVVASANPIYAAPDSYMVDTGTTLTVAAPGVQANDIASNGNAFTSSVVAGPAHGQVLLGPDGAFSYVPAAGFTGIDTFTYIDSQGSKTSNVATVTIDVLPKVYVVTNTNDSGPGSLRQAILNANMATSPTPDTIKFKIGGTGPFTITPATPLPAVTHPTVIDGYTQPGAKANTLAQGDNAVILVRIDGSAANSSGTVNGLTITAGGSTVRGLAITSFQDAIALTTSGADLVAGDFLGTDVTGTTTAFNYAGVEVSGTAANTIGGASPAARNLISGNQIGVLLDSGASANTVAGDYLGTDPTGTQPLANGAAVSVNSPNNTIGGTSSGASNLISGNESGIVVFTGGSGTLVLGNLIGTDATGTLVLQNTQGGVGIFQVSNVTIGGTSAKARNVISGSRFDGIDLFDQGSSPTNILIEGNYIGTDVTGTKALGNGRDGIITIDLNGFPSPYASGVTIGGTAAGAGNVISGNANDGIDLASQSIASLTIQGNRIGTNAAGTAALGNGVAGIFVASSGNMIGGTSAVARNLISGNGRDGVDFLGETQHLNASGNAVEGDFIGTDVTGSKALGNSRDGVHMDNQTQSNTIGGTVAGAGNTIAFNGGAGIGTAPGVFGPIDNSFLSNSIHDNGGLGIDLGDDGVTPNTPGGPHRGPNNLQNFPVLSSATTSSGGTTIQGTLNGAPSTTFTIQLFASPTADPSGYGEGQTYLGQVTVTTDANGNASFSLTVKTVVPAGQVVSATATDPNGNTSEFSQDIAVAAASTSVVTVKSAGVGQPIAATPSVAASLPATTSAISLVTSPQLPTVTIPLDDSILDEVALDVARTRHRKGVGAD